MAEVSPASGGVGGKENDKKHQALLALVALKGQLKGKGKGKGTLALVDAPNKNTDDDTQLDEEENDSDYVNEGEGEEEEDLEKDDIEEEPEKPGKGKPTGTKQPAKTETVSKRNDAESKHKKGKTKGSSEAGSATGAKEDVGQKKTKSKGTKNSPEEEKPKKSKGQATKESPEEKKSKKAKEPPEEEKPKKGKGQTTKGPSESEKPKKEKKHEKEPNEPFEDCTPKKKKPKGSKTEHADPLYPDDPQKRRSLKGADEAKLKQTILDDLTCVIKTKRPTFTTSSVGANKLHRCKQLTLCTVVAAQGFTGKRRNKTNTGQARGKATKKGQDGQGHLVSLWWLYLIVHFCQIVFWPEHHNNKTCFDMCTLLHVAGSDAAKPTLMLDCVSEISTSAPKPIIGSD